MRSTSLQTPDGFRSLAEVLRSSQAPVPDPAPEKDELLPEAAVAVRDIRLFRARIAEAAELAVRDLCEDIAVEVLARELQLAPAEISEIVRRALERHEAEGIARIRVHPDEAAAISDERVCADESLRRGDAVLDVAYGSIDVSLGVRLASVIRAVR